MYHYVQYESFAELLWWIAVHQIEGLLVLLFDVQQSTNGHVVRPLDVIKYEKCNEIILIFTFGTIWSTEKLKI
jgi:hypothetical protein